MWWLCVKSQRKQARILEALELAKQVGLPAWVEVNADKAEGTFKKSPDRDEFAADINESLDRRTVFALILVDVVDLTPPTQHARVAWFQTPSLTGVTSRGY